MLKIALCDDQLPELEIIYTQLGEYFKANDWEVEVKKFSHPDALLSAIGNTNFHIYILDIVMPMVNGLELGKEIRRKDREAQIIYATTEPQFALQAYAANPINYLIKPIDKNQLFDTITRAISKINLTEEQTFTVKTADGVHVINLSDILCCEYRSHSVFFTLKNGEEIVSRTMRESFASYICAILDNRYFLRCHNAFAVNMRYVERFAKDRFTLRGGKTLPIAPKQYKAVRDAYMDYLMAKGNEA